MSESLNPPAEESSFLRDFVLLCKGTEIPDIFALWCGIAGISCVLGRRLWIDMGTYTIYPNLYVVLVAGSGRCRKSTVVNMIEKLIFQLDPRPNLISQKITPEALIDALKVTEVTEKKIFVRQTSEGFVIIDELSTFLNRKTYESGLASLLIPLYDCKEGFDYRTKGRGTERIVKSCLGLLGASTIDWIRNAIPIDAIGGGLTSRMIFVYVQDPPPPVAITTFDHAKRVLSDSLIRRLEKMLKLDGEVKLTPEAWKQYEESYDVFYTKSPLFDNHTLSGYASRRHVHLLKIGTCMAVAEMPETGVVVDRRHLEGAEELLRESERFMPRVLSLVSASEHGALTEIVADMIGRHGTFDRQDLLRALSHRLDSRELTEIVETLIQSGRVKSIVRGNKIVYVLAGKETFNDQSR